MSICVVQLACCKFLYMSTSICVVLLACCKILYMSICVVLLACCKFLFLNHEYGPKGLEYVDFMKMHSCAKMAFDC